jgi:hypothetical protein
MCIVYPCDQQRCPSSKGTPYNRDNRPLFFDPNDERIFFPRACDLLGESQRRGDAGILLAEYLHILKNLCGKQLDPQSFHVRLGKTAGTVQTRILLDPGGIRLLQAFPSNGGILQSLLYRLGREGEVSQNEKKKRESCILLTHHLSSFLVNLEVRIFSVQIVTDVVSDAIL